MRRNAVVIVLALTRATIWCISSIQYKECWHFLHRYQENMGPTAPNQNGTQLVFWDTHQQQISISLS
ncbi:hypothetical protein RDI58_006296 [Solanum bulbocastanum]|uniref:Secreted protein n=1 Tax=Solanum bulbocastanum TaxID=147425 RepID=A0AAN8UAF6_SOLBU